MANRKENISEQIIDLIDAAISTRNFDTLNDKINDILNPGGTDYKPLDHMMYGSSYMNRQQQAMNASGAGRAAYEERRRRMMAGQPHDVNMGVRPRQTVRLNNDTTNDHLFRTPEGEATAGKLLMIFGGIALAVNALNLFGMLLDFEGLAPMIGRLIALGVSGVFFTVGTELTNRVKRFKKYVGALKNKLYAAISDLGRLVGKNQDYVRKDLQKMIDKGMFTEGHLDDNGSTMIASDALYMQYRETQQRSQQLRAEKAAKEKEEGKLSPEAQKVLTKGDEYLRKIHAANEAMPEETITGKLNRLEMIISKIFGRVKTAPEEARNLSQFMDYYLPTTWKLISAYQEMESQPVQGENIQSAKKEILESLDTINDAFETLLDGMFKEKAWDVSTDISVMKSMMKQDGLTGSDFTPQGGAAAMAAPAKRTEMIKEEK